MMLHFISIMHASFSINISANNLLFLLSTNGSYIYTFLQWWQNGKDVLHIVGAKLVRVDETAAAVNWITWA